MHLFNSLLGGLRGAWNSGNQADYGRSRYSDWVTSQEAWADARVDGPMSWLFHPRRTWREMRGIEPPAKDWAGIRKKAGAMGMRLGEGVYEAAYRGVRLGGRALNIMGGGRGLATTTSLVGAQLIGGGLRTLQGAELGARFMLTGSFGLGAQPKNALEAYLPGWNRYQWGDIRKYGVNPRIPRRYIAFQAAKGLFAGLEEAMNPTIAPPQMYVEAGGGIRHHNDLGASAAYGQQMLGPNSLMTGYNQMSRAQKIALLDAVV